MKDFFKPKINEKYQTYRREPLYREQSSAGGNEEVIFASTGDNRVMSSVQSIPNLAGSYTFEQKIAAFA